MNPFKAIGRKVAAPFRATTQHARDTRQLFGIYRAWLRLLRLGQRGQADPALYQDPAYQQALINDAADLATRVPLPEPVHRSIPIMQTLLTNAWAHPKTTAMGFAAGVLTLMAGGMDWKHALLAVALAGGGMAAADGKH